MINEVYGATAQARLLALACGTALCAWTWSRLGKRSLLLSVGSILTAAGLGLVTFALAPSVFDYVAYRAGVKYPPLLYLMILLIFLCGMLLHLAVRISVLDTRCRRLTQEVALLGAERHAAGVPTSPVAPVSA